MTKKKEKGRRKGGGEKECTHQKAESGSPQLGEEQERRGERNKVRQKVGRRFLLTAKEKDEKKAAEEEEGGEEE